jgi:caa(3)-type oxidase subunit IV
MNETESPAASESVVQAHPDHDDHHDVSKHIKKYLMVGGALMILTVITVALSYFDFGSHNANIAVGMLVATFKAGLVAAIFMHLSAERHLVYQILIFTTFFVLGLFWLTYLAWYDPVVR